MTSAWAGRRLLLFPGDRDTDPAEPGLPQRPNMPAQTTTDTIMDRLAQADAAYRAAEAAADAELRKAEAAYDAARKAHTRAIDAANKARSAAFRCIA